MILGELHSSELPRLQREFANDTAVQVVPGDGYHLLKSHLPPPERRGMVLIDPSYERRDEIDVLLTALREGYRRWDTGVFAVWYPIIPKIPVAALKRRVVGDGYAKLLSAELCVLPEDNPLGMNGSGMLILNPPFQVDAVLIETLPWLHRALANANQGSHRVVWLSGH